MGVLGPGDVIDEVGQQRARAGEEHVKRFHGAPMSKGAREGVFPLAVCPVYHKQRDFTREKTRKHGESFCQWFWGDEISSLCGLSMYPKSTKFYQSLSFPALPLFFVCAEGIFFYKFAVIPAES